MKLFDALPWDALKEAALSLGFLARRAHASGLVLHTLSNPCDTPVCVSTGTLPGARNSLIQLVDYASRAVICFFTEAARAARTNLDQASQGLSHTKSLAHTPVMPRMRPNSHKLHEVNWCPL